MSRTKICFISHNATRTGAPIVLFHFVKWMIEKHPENAVEIWFMEEGEMITDFEKLCTCRVVPPSLPKGIIQRGIRKISKYDPRKTFLKQLRLFDLIFFNTASSLSLVSGLPDKLQSRIFLWLHEQPLSIRLWYHDFFTKQNLNLFEKIFCVSSQTKNWLENKFDFESAHTIVIHPFIDQSWLQKKVQQQQNDKTNEPCFIIGGCGLQDWRKGPDLFLGIAKYISKHYPEFKIQFVWVGGESGMTVSLQYELEQMKLSQAVKFTGSLKDASVWFAKFDVFLLTSREDPFPLVVLEACAFKKPVICFDGIGDITKITRTIPENVVSYSDVEAMAERIVYYYNNPVKAQNDGHAYFSQIERYDKDVIAPLLYDAMF